MFCPKCGTKNPDDGRFCRKCGTNLGNVSTALSDNNSSARFQDSTPVRRNKKGRFISDDPTEVYAESIKQILMGIGFFIVAIVLLKTGVAGGQFWWWSMLIPAFTMLGKGISDYMKSKRMEQRQLNMVPEPKMVINEQPAKSALPPTNTDYIPTDFSNYQTGDLIPPSVVENTTRHLEMDKEGETMTLPKSNL